MVSKRFRANLSSIFTPRNRVKGHLAGQIETDNSARGYDNCIPEPLVIGSSKEIKYKADNEPPSIRQESYNNTY